MRRGRLGIISDVIGTEGLCGRLVIGTRPSGGPYGLRLTGGLSRRMARGGCGCTRLRGLGRVVGSGLWGCNIAVR